MIMFVHTPWCTRAEKPPQSSLRTLILKKDTFPATRSSRNTNDRAVRSSTSVITCTISKDFRRRKARNLSIASWNMLARISTFYPSSGRIPGTWFCGIILPSCIGLTEAHMRANSDEICAGLLCMITLAMLGVWMTNQPRGLAYRRVYRLHARECPLLLGWEKWLAKEMFSTEKGERVMGKKTSGKSNLLN